MSISFSTVLSPFDLESLDELFRRDLSENSDSPTRDQLRKMIQQKARFVIAKDDRVIIGFACLIQCHLLRFSFGVIHDVVVKNDPRYRRKGIGRNMIRLLLNQSVQDGLKFVELTSRPSREEANRLYVSMGFERKNTNMYVMYVYRWHPESDPPHAA